LLGAAGAVLSSLEESISGISRIPTVLFPSQQDPGVAQLILSSIVTSIMTVVSIAFAILLMTLTAASTQFSPRILICFVRDHTTKWTLGAFLGTFSYCMAALPDARALPYPFVPAATVSGAMLLALVCVAWLIFFMHHISQSISVNHIVDRIARETDLVIDEFMPHARSPFQLENDVGGVFPSEESAAPAQPEIWLNALYRHRSADWNRERMRNPAAAGAPGRKFCAGRRSDHPGIKAGTNVGGCRDSPPRRARYRPDL
jgi:uncharacterized membrane protein